MSRRQVVFEPEQDAYWVDGIGQTLDESRPFFSASTMMCGNDSGNGIAHLLGHLYGQFAVFIAPARKFRMLPHSNPTRQRGETTGSLAGASGWSMTFFVAGVINHQYHAHRRRAFFVEAKVAVAKNKGDRPKFR